MSENEVRVNERKRLVTALRRRAAATFGEAGRLASVPRQVPAAKAAVQEAATLRQVAALIEEGAL
jgi:hypothetical protein